MTTLELPGDATAPVSVTGRRLAAFLAAFVVGLVRVVGPHLFTIAALSSFTVAAFTAWGTAGGLLVLGVSLLLFEWKVKS